MYAVCPFVSGRSNTASIGCRPNPGLHTDRKSPPPWLNSGSGDTRDEENRCYISQLLVSHRLLPHFLSQFPDHKSPDSIDPQWAIRYSKNYLPHQRLCLLCRLRSAAEAADFQRWIVGEIWVRPRTSGIREGCPVSWHFFEPAGPELWHRWREGRLWRHKATCARPRCRRWLATWRNVAKNGCPFCEFIRPKIGVKGAWSMVEGSSSEFDDCSGGTLIGVDGASIGTSIGVGWYVLCQQPPIPIRTKLVRWHEHNHQPWLLCDRI